MRRKPIIFSFFFVALFACSENSNTDKKQDNLGHLDSVVDFQKQKKQVVGGLTFSDTCLCSFDNIATIKRNKNKIDLIISGKKWNSASDLCNFAWGEITHNSPQDPSITDFKIHLVDLDKLENNIDSTFLTSKIFNDHLIATYSETQNKRHCIFDPNKTKKYPKPKEY